MNSSSFSIRPIGVIRTSYMGPEDNVPMQGRLVPDGAGEVHIYPEFKEGLDDLEGFSHIFLLYIFHRTTVMKLRAKPYLDTKERGVFSIRSPHRPNRIGLTLVNLLSIDNGVLKVGGVDMLDGTPLIDIKPYSPKFDRPGEGESVLTGWMKNKSVEDYMLRGRIGSRRQWLHEDFNPSS